MHLLKHAFFACRIPATCYLLFLTYTLLFWLAICHLLFLTFQAFVLSIRPMDAGCQLTVFEPNLSVITSKPTPKKRGSNGYDTLCH